MSQITIFKWATAVLVLINIALAIFIFNLPIPHQGHKLLDQVPKILNLDEAQTDKFKGMAKGHHEKMSKLEREQRVLISAHFGQLYFKPIRQENIGKQQKDLNLEKITALELDKINLTYEHFEEVKSLLTANQLPYYKNFVEKATHSILTKSKKERRPPKDN